MRRTAVERFWEKVELLGHDGCWLWTGATNSRGYGHFFDGGRTVGAHRWSYELLIAPVPDGLVLDHLCRVVRCVNPWHLEPVTQKENVHRGIGTAAANLSVKFCPQGHEYDEVNTYCDPKGKRECRKCRLGSSRRYEASGRRPPRPRRPRVF